ncbi:MAG: PEP-CTERM sorting domain-containing protein [Limisphaerales bacterium]
MKKPNVMLRDKLVGPASGSVAQQLQEQFTIKLLRTGPVASLRLHGRVVTVLLLFLALSAGKAYADFGIINAGTAPAGANDIAFFFTWDPEQTSIPTGYQFSLDGGGTWSPVGNSTVTTDSSQGTGYADLYGTIPSGPNTFTIALADSTIITEWYYTKDSANIDPIDPNTGIPAIYTTGISYSETAVPEPSTFALLGLGTLNLLGYEWRRRMAKA